MMPVKAPSRWIGLNLVRDNNNVSIHILGSLILCQGHFYLCPRLEGEYEFEQSNFHSALCLERLGPRQRSIVV